MRIKFYGARGSFPKTGRSVLEYGGNTTCLRVDSNAGDVYIMDAGTGIVDLGDELMAEQNGQVNAKLFITHDHWDHIQGFPFFVPAYVPGCNIDVYSGDKDLAKKLSDQNKRSGTGVMRKTDMEKRLARATAVSHRSSDTNHTKRVFEGQQDVERGYFPVDIGMMGADLTFRDLKRHEVVENGMSVSFMYHNAHPGGMFSYKLQEGGITIVNAGDYEHDGLLQKLGEFGPIDRKMIEWARGADVLIIDGQYTPEEYDSKRTWGHSQIEEICRLAASAEVGKLVITHHDPRHDDAKLAEMELKARNYMKTMRGDSGVVFAKEGMEIEL